MKDRTSYKLEQARLRQFRGPSADCQAYPVSLDNAHADYLVSNIYLKLIFHFILTYLIALFVLVGRCADVREKHFGLPCRCTSAGIEDKNHMEIRSMISIG